MEVTHPPRDATTCHASHAERATTSIKYDATKLCKYVKQGYATAEMTSSPSGFAVLEHDNATGRSSTASFTDWKGRATFTGLFVNETGEGFVCRFVAFNAAGVGVAWIDSEPFDVGVGEPYAIAMSTSVGRMQAGSTFDIPPVISVQVSPEQVRHMLNNDPLRRISIALKVTPTWMAGDFFATRFSSLQQRQQRHYALPSSARSSLCYHGTLLHAASAA